MSADKPSGHQVLIDGSPIDIETVAAVAQHERQVVISSDADYRARLERSVATLHEVLASGRRVYGVTTGFGDSCEVNVEDDAVLDLPMNLVRFHGCGTGALLSEAETAATLMVRLVSLSLGHSAVRPQLLELLAQLLNQRILPLIPEEGSVGASGDLTPLSYVAAALMGERQVRFAGKQMLASEALARVGLLPLRLEQKESLALMNGTSVMTALGCLNFIRARRLLRLGAALTAMAAQLLDADVEQFDDKIFAVKPHPGQRLCAAWIRADLDYDERTDRQPPGRLQDRYSVRCAPHILGVCADTLLAAKSVIEVEVNSVNDNPIIDSELGRVWHGGNFYGGHICQVMDTLKTSVANVADLLDRQLVLLCNPVTNGGLPANLVGARGPGRSAHHGFKAMQIGTSALVAEACKLTMPASVFSRSTENHNQDKVSMGSIAARDCRRILELTETCAVMHLLALCQAYDLRCLQGQPPTAKPLARLHRQVRELVPFNDRDRAMDLDIQSVLLAYRERRLFFGDDSIDPGEQAAAAT